MDGGGFRLVCWKSVAREMRMWYEETTLADVLKLVLNSVEWKQLQIEHPNVTLGRNSLRLALCPSVRKPTFRSCVNERMSALMYLMEDFYKLVNNNEVIKKRIEECECQRHQAARAMKALQLVPPPFWYDELRCLPSKFCAMATCPKEEQPYLRVEGKDTPKLRAKPCTTSNCPNCGFDTKLGLGDSSCKVFSECDELMEATLWDKAARNGGRFQLEPTRFTGDKMKKVSEVYGILTDDVAPIALEHLGEAQWYHAQMDRKISTFAKDEIVILTDFSATPELIAKEVGNCHEAQHCVIDIFVVLSDPRVVTIIDKDGQAIQKRINSCTYWAFFGPTDGKGKKNDHRFHRECLNAVADYHKKELAERSITLQVITMLTDNCTGQYKNQFAMGDVAWFSEKHTGVRLEHCFAPVYEFKGVHDGFGKVVKWKFKSAELVGIRLPHAQGCYGHMLKDYAGRRTEWDDLEAELSPKLLGRGPFTMTEARFGYVADTAEEVLAVQQSIGGEHVLHCDRESVPRAVGDKAVEGLMDLYNIRGKKQSIRSNGPNHFWEIEVATRICFCSVCSTRDSHNQKCPYHDLRNAKTIVVDDKSTDINWCQDVRATKAMKDYFRREKKETGYINMDRMKEELDRLGKPYAPTAKRTELCHVFLSMVDDSATSEQQDLLMAVDDAIQFPEQPSADDDVMDEIGTERDLPLSEEEAPTDIDQLCMNDIIEEERGNDFNMSDQELKTVTDFSIFNDNVLHLLLAQRRLPTTGSRSEQEDRLSASIITFT